MFPLRRPAQTWVPAGAGLNSGSGMQTLATWRQCVSKSNACGGETGIRTLETVPRLHAFQACAFDHSATSPSGGAYSFFGAAFKLHPPLGETRPRSTRRT